MGRPMTALVLAACVMAGTFIPYFRNQDNQEQP